MKKYRRKNINYKKKNLIKISKIIVAIIILAICIFSIIGTQHEKKTEINQEKTIISALEEKESVQDVAYISSSSITQTVTGTAPFDTETTADSQNSDGTVVWKAGDDLSEEDNIVRSFDQITWTIDNTFSLSQNAEVTELSGGTIKLEASVPTNLANLVTWDLGSMNWAENGVISEDGTTFTAEYSMSEESINIPGKQSLVLVLKILEAPNKTEIIPTFTTSLGIKNNEGELEYSEEVISTGSTIYVSAAPKYNIQIKKSGYLNKKGEFDLDTGDIVDESTDTSTHTIITGRMQGYGITVQLYNDTADKGLKGIELPKGEISFDITLTEQDSSKNELTDEEYIPILWDYKENENITKAGKNGRNVCWDEVSTWMARACAPYGFYGIQDGASCYDSGEWKIDSNSNNTGKYHVTINNYEINMNYFPFKNAFNSGNTVIYGANVGCFSAGYIEVILQHPQEVGENKNLYLTVRC